MILFRQDYSPWSQHRKEELDRCHRENVASGLFDEIVRVDGDARRWTYNDFFEIAARDFRGSVCVIANSDISFRHDSCREIRSAIRPGWLLALTRWHDDCGPWCVGQHFDNRFFAGSQDVWGFVGGDFVGLAGIELGQPGCDCLLTAKAIRAGASVWNPCLSIRTMHVHRDLNDVGRPAPAGEYGYAEMTTTDGAGSVLLMNFAPASIVDCGRRERTS